MRRSTVVEFSREDKVKNKIGNKVDGKNVPASMCDPSVANLKGSNV